MKRIIASGAIALAIPLIAFLPNNQEQPKASPKPTPSITSEIHAVAVEPTSSPIPTPTPTPAPTWQDNPQGCNTDSQWIAAIEPFSCINKPQPEPMPITQPKIAANTPTAAQEVQTVTQLQPVSSGNVQDIIVRWANHYGVDSNWMLRVAKCESGFSPTAQNKNYYAGGGNPSGVFQFLPQTFYANATRAGVVNANLWSVDHQAQVAAYMFKIGQSGQWECT